MKSQGITDVELVINGNTYIWHMYVAPIGDDLLLGADFLEEHGVTVNMRWGLKIKDERVQCENEKRPSWLGQVSLPEPWTIPTNHESQLTIPKEEDFHSPSQYAIIEPLFEDNRNLMIARVLVDASQSYIPIRCVNLSPEPITRQKGYVIGAMHAMTEVLGEVPHKEQLEPCHICNCCMEPTRERESVSWLMIHNMWNVPWEMPQGQEVNILNLQEWDWGIPLDKAQGEIPKDTGISVPISTLKERQKEDRRSQKDSDLPNIWLHLLKYLNTYKNSMTGVVTGYPNPW